MCTQRLAYYFSVVVHSILVAMCCDIHVNDDVTFKWQNVYYLLVLGGICIVLDWKHLVWIASVFRISISLVMITIRFTKLCISNAIVNSWTEPYEMGEGFENQHANPTKLTVSSILLFETNCGVPSMTTRNMKKKKKKNMFTCNKKCLHACVCVSVCQSKSSKFMWLERYTIVH